MWYSLPQCRITSYNVCYTKLLRFVTSINGVAGVRGEMAWYYMVNGEKPKLAIQQPVKAGDKISWRYVKDICSCTVDGSKKK